jgi:hypothetical protein
MCTVFQIKKLKGRDQFGDLRIQYKLIFMASDRLQCWAVATIMIPQIPYMAGIFFTS